MPMEYMSMLISGPKPVVLMFAEPNVSGKTMATMDKRFVGAFINSDEKKFIG